MKKATGIVLILLGLIGLMYGGLTFNIREKVIDAGPIEVTREKPQTLPVPQFLGAALLIGGITLVALGFTESRSGR